MTGKSQEWVSGYRAAMCAIAKECARGAREMEREIHSTPNTLFGTYTVYQHRLWGSSKALKEIKKIAFTKAAAALPKRP